MTDKDVVAAQDRCFAEQYADAFKDCVTGGGEKALTCAYELGRKAVANGLGLLELAALHHEALALAAGNELGASAVLPLAAQFFAETLSPFELTLRAYRANARMLGLSETAGPRNAEIQRSREQLHTILDATTALIYLKDAQGRYLFVNRQFANVFGLAREYVLGKRDEEFLPPAVAALLSANDRGVFDGGVPQELEESVTGTAGTATYISLKVPLLDAAQTAYALCCVATDITERKRADEALKRATEAAEEANRELEAFSYSVAHDLRAPLRTIDGFSHALLEDCADGLSEDGKRYADYLRVASQRMGQMIDDLLRLSRVAGSDIHHERVNLSTLARSVFERLKVTQPERRVEFVAERGVFAYCDARLLEIVFENLLGNAWKFTSKVDDARIEFREGMEGGRLVYLVRDNGAGFDMAHAHRLFGVFQRLHSSKEFEGTGIGLATVQRVIRRHGGRIWAEGSPGAGAVFRFTLEEKPSSP